MKTTSWKNTALALICATIALTASVAAADEGELHPVLTVTNVVQNWEDLAFTIENPGSESEAGVVVVWFYEDGNLTGWGYPVDIPAGTALHLGLRLPDGGPVLGVPVYKTPPDSITDGADPVMQVYEPVEEERGGSGGGGNKN